MIWYYSIAIQYLKHLHKHFHFHEHLANMYDWFCEEVDSKSEFYHHRTWAHLFLVLSKDFESSFDCLPSSVVCQTFLLWVAWSWLHRYQSSDWDRWFLFWIDFAKSEFFVRRWPAQQGTKISWLECRRCPVLLELKFRFANIKKTMAMSRLNSEKPSFYEKCCSGI